MTPHQAARRAWIESPFQIMVCLAMAIVGAVGLVSGTYAIPGTLERNLPMWVQLMWNIALLAGGVVTLVGRLRIRSRIESAGLALLAYGCGVYAVMLAVLNMPSSIVNLSAMVAVTVACFMRLWVLRKARVAESHYRE